MNSSSGSWHIAEEVSHLETRKGIPSIPSFVACGSHHWGSLITSESGQPLTATGAEPRSPRANGIPPGKCLLKAIPSDHFVITTGYKPRISCSCHQETVPMEPDLGQSIKWIFLASKMGRWPHHYVGDALVCVPYMGIFSGNQQGPEKDAGKR